jgi:hypothetical protein
MIDAQHDSAISGQTDLRRIEEGDTVGYSFIDQASSPWRSATFFSRQLFDRVGGFRDLAHIYAWDFSLRALWFDEPAFVPTAEYLRRIDTTGDESTPLRQEQELAQIAMFTEFYAKACDGTAPRNPYAPSLHNWRMQLLKKSFQVGHVLAFPLERLEVLAGQIAKRRMATAGTAALPGVNLVGFAFGEFGLAENLRAMAKACLLGDIPFVVRDVDMRLKTRQADRTLGPYIADELRHACSVFCLNPDMLKPIRHLLKSGTATRRYNIGFWFWELEQIPREWLYAIEAVDEIWVATEFVREAMRSVTSKPVTKVPTPIEVNLSRPYTRSEFGLPEGRFLFLFSFDFNSFVMRKNPEGAIAAFKSAFADARRDVLVIKSINESQPPPSCASYRSLSVGTSASSSPMNFSAGTRFLVLRAWWMPTFSLHGPRFGPGAGESMYLGKLVIGTAYSGNLEFMDADNSCLVDYRLIPIRKGEYLYDDERFRWAEPDLEQARTGWRGWSTMPNSGPGSRSAAARHPKPIYARPCGGIDARGSPSWDCSSHPKRTMTFISYAQNYEDVMLWRALGTCRKASISMSAPRIPTSTSVTRAFYERGWSGINIEPVPKYHEWLCRASAARHQPARGGRRGGERA